MGKRPNILFIFSDQQHWEAVGFCDSSFDTPNLNRLAEEGTIFTHAFCTTPQCSPSRSSMLTGLYPSTTGVYGNCGTVGGDPLRMRTIGAILQDAGYATGYFGKWHLDKNPVGIAGWDEDLGVTGDEIRDDDAVTRHALDFLSRHDNGEKPFALFLAYDNPHNICKFNRETNLTPKAPMPLPETWHQKDISSTPSVQKEYITEDKPSFMNGAPESTWQRYREFYREKVTLYDREVGRVLEKVQEMDLFKDTLILATSDHGDMDGQHGMVWKGPLMYEHMMRVPLIIRMPDSQRPSSCPSETNFLCVNVDLPPTLADFARAPMPECDGHSLKPILTGKGVAPERDAVVGQYYSKQKWINPIRMLRTSEFKYTRYQVHGEELYNLQEDPQELRNLADDPSYADAKAQLSAKLDRWIIEHDDPFPELSPTTRNGRPLERTNSG
jgi:arylsulfatase A-like enzyme